MKRKMSTKILVTTALCISISVVLTAFSLMITAGGAVTMKITFGAIFYILPGLLFGPLYGAIAGGMTDIIAYIIRPMGPYIPVLTLTKIIAGLLPALIWKKIKDTSISKLKNSYIAFFAVVTIIGILNALIINVIPQSFLGKLFMSIGKKSQYLSIGFLLVGAAGFILLIVNNIIKAKSNNSYSYVYNDFFKLVISVGISGVLVSTIDTYFLLIFTPALIGKGFMILWIPRIVQTLIMTMINSYALSILIYSYSALTGRVPKKI